MKIGIIGCGNMGQALVKGLLSKSLVCKRDILVSDKDKRKMRSLNLRFKVHLSKSNSDLVKKCNVVIIAVKPQDLNSLIAELDATIAFKGKLIISICAGVSTKRLESYLGKVSVARVMPNMPAQISQGVSALCLGRYANAKDKRIALSIFSCIGQVVELKEKLMDEVTAISGSGPAYFFYLTETLIKAAKRMGIPERIAAKLAVQTALGSALLMQQCAESPQDLRIKVTSKGGTTEAAFNVFTKKGLNKILYLGFRAAAKRSSQLKR